MPRRRQPGPPAAPQGVTRARPVGRVPPGWRSLSATTCSGTAWPAPSVDPIGSADRTLADAAGRRERHDDLNTGLADWTRTRPVDTAVAALARVGVPAAEVLTVPCMFDDPQLAARGYYVTLDHVRDRAAPLPGLADALLLEPSPAPTRAPPTLGQHNAEILAGELGLDAAELAALTDAGVVGDRIPT